MPVPAFTNFRQVGLKKIFDQLDRFFRFYGTQKLFIVCWENITFSHFIPPCSDFDLENGVGGGFGYYWTVGTAQLQKLLLNW
jgi:hypothetical protein